MHFASLSEFFAMGGYGFFVWLAFGGSFAVLIGLYWLGCWQSKKIKSGVLTELARIERIKGARKARQTKSIDQGEVAQ